MPTNLFSPTSAQRRSHSIAALAMVLWMPVACAVDVYLPAPSATKTTPVQVELPVPVSSLPASPHTLTLRDALLLGLRYNPQIIDARLDQTVQHFALQVAHNAYQPQWHLDANTRRQHAWSSTANTDSSFMPSMHYQNTFGTQVDLRSTRSYVSPATGERYHETSSTLTVTQPLLRGAGEVAGYPLLDAEERVLIDDMRFRHQVMSHITQTVRAYHAWVHRIASARIQRMALQDSEAQLQQLTLKRKLGKAAGSDLVMQSAQVARERLALEEGQNAIHDQQQKLWRLLGLDVAHMQDVHPTESLDVTAWVKPLPASVQAEALALRHSEAYQAAQLNYHKAQRDLKAAQNNRLWQLDVEASTHWNHSQSAGSETGSGTGDKTIGLNVRIPIHDMSVQERLLSANVALKEKEEALHALAQNIRSDVRNQWRDLASQKAQVALAKQAAEMASLNMRNAKLKFKYGRVSAFEVTSLRTRLTEQQLAYMYAKIAYVDHYMTCLETIGQTLAFWDIGWQEVARS